MMRTTRRFVLLAVLAVPGVAALGGCGRTHSARASASGESPVPVSAAVLRAIDRPRRVEAVGSVHGAQEATIASKMMGTVTEIRRSPGDAVRKGEVLLVIDGRDVAGQILQARGALAQARAAAHLAEANLRRFERLHERGSASPAELDQARFQHETARGAVEQAEGAVAAAESYESYATVTAPFDGRVVERLCDVGDLAAPGRPLMRLEGTGRMRLHVWLDAGRIDLARVGTRVGVEIPSAGTSAGRLEGTVVETAAGADPATHTFLVKIDLPEDAPAIRSGLFGRAWFPAGSRTTLAVPRAALQRRGGITGLYVAEEGRVAFRLVTVDDDAPGDSVEVLSGIAEGDRLIAPMPAGLEIGSPIEVRE